MTNFATVFLDTEFTDLSKPQLLSVGIVGEGVEFYAEVTDPQILNAASDFVKDIVLPQFARMSGAACSYSELCRRLAEFLSEMTAALRDDEYIVVAFDFETDWELVKESLENAGKPGQRALSCLIPVDINHLVSQAAAELAQKSYFELQQWAPLAQHHALCDARALRIAHQAASTG